MNSKKITKNTISELFIVLAKKRKRKKGVKKREEIKNPKRRKKVKRPKKKRKKNPESLS